MPVGFAGQEGGEGLLIEAAGLEEDFEDGVVVGFGDVVGSLLVVGIGAIFEKETGESGVVGDAGGGIEDGLGNFSRRIFIEGFRPAGVRAGTGVEQSASREDEGVGAGWVEAEITREAEVGDRVPVMRSAVSGGERGITGEEGADGGLIGEDRCRVNAGGGDMGIAGEDELRVLEPAGAVPAVTGDAGEFDEGVDGVSECGAGGRVFEGLDEAKRFKVRGKLWPGWKAVLAGNEELAIGEDDGG